MRPSVEQSVHPHASITGSNQSYCQEPAAPPHGFQLAIPQSKDSKWRTCAARPVAAMNGECAKRGPGKLLAGA